MDGIINSVDINLSKLWEIVKDRKACCVLQSMGLQRIGAFELWCWRRLLNILWTARRSSQSILREISPEYSLEGLMLKLKLQYFGYLMRTDSLKKSLMLGKIETEGEGGNRGSYGWMVSLTQLT